MKHSESREITRQNLIDAFWEIYTVKRIEEIIVREVANKAGYNRSTFYEYFLDIYDCLEQIENSLIPKFDQLPNIELLQGKENMPTHMITELFEKNSKFFSILLGKKGNPAFSYKLKDSIKPLLCPTVQATFKLSNIETDFLLEYSLSALIGVLSYWFEKNKPITSNELVELIMNFSTTKFNSNKEI